MANEPIGKGRKAIFGGPQSSEIKPQSPKDEALSLKVETIASQPGEVELKDDGHKPSEIKPQDIKDNGLSLKAKSSEAMHRPSKEIQPKADSPKPETLGLKDQGLNLKPDAFNLEVLQQVISDSKSSRKTIAVWSPVISAALWYLKATTPMYSISDAARAWVEAGLERDHPELIKRIKAEMERGKRV